MSNYDAQVQARRMGPVGLYPGASPQRAQRLAGVSRALGAYPNPDSSDAVAQALASFQATVDLYKAKIESINAGLYANAQARGDGASLGAWSSWHNSAVSWESYAGTVASQLQQLANQGILTQEGWAAARAAAAGGNVGAQTVVALFSDVAGSSTPAQSIVNDFVAQGLGVANDAKATMSAIAYDDSVSTAVSDVVSNLPGQFQNALNAIIKAAGGTVSLATWELLKPIALVAGAALLILWGLKALGVSANYGPVRFNERKSTMNGSYGAYHRVRRGRAGPRGRYYKRGRYGHRHRRHVTMQRRRRAPLVRGRFLLMLAGAVGLYLWLKPKGMTPDPANATAGLRGSGLGAIVAGR